MAAVDVRDPRVADGALARPTAEAADLKTPPIKIWAGIGAACLVLFAYVLISWVTGPYFEEVPQGPSDPPSWMQVELVLWQVFSIPAALYLLWRFALRPYMRERTIPTDGLLLIGFASMWVQDPWSSMGNHWFVYNTSMVNYGSWAQEMPGFNAFGAPGAMTSEPILFTPAAYVYIMLVAAACGCWVMRKARERWPQTTNFQLVALCFVFMCIFDVVLEGMIWLPLGVFEYPGGHWSIFPNSYHKYPLNEMVTIGAVFTAISALRFFKDDRGNTFVERGVDKLRMSPGKTVALRALACVAFINIAMFLGYTVPNTAIGFNSTPWPNDLQERSYFTNFLCGDGTDRLCPGGKNPTIKEDSLYPTPDGKIGGPSGGSNPENPPIINENGGTATGSQVPFDRGKPGGDE